MELGLGDWYAGLNDEMARWDRSFWVNRASEQIEFDEVALTATDRCIVLGGEDVLLCETTCLGYAEHALANGIGELWLIPPHIDSDEYDEELFESFKQKLYENYGPVINRLEGYKGFRGMAANVPDHPFKLLVSDSLAWTPFHGALECSVENSFWNEMLDSDGSAGVVVCPLPNRVEEGPTSLLESNAAGAYYMEHIVRAVELPNGCVLLATGEQKGIIHVEDLGDVDDPWICDVPAITPAVNGGCLIPSRIRSGVEVVRETTLGDLASRISRGTTLSEKALDVEREKKRPDDIDPRLWEVLDLVSDGEGDTPSYDKVHAPNGDLYYIDGSCLQDREIRPKVLKDMPKGQERYTIDSHDGKVLLVTRNGKDVFAYTASRPTLIGNGVFVIRPGHAVDVDYLACWMHGLFAKVWMEDKGGLLTKTILSSLPVPILSDELMRQTVQYERSIDVKIYALEREIMNLESSNRFNPLAAVKESPM